jgi:uncharacterized repeat protein (TIGR03837 family)
MQVWDIFCRVVDNYGDAGVTWRLARQLAAEHGVRARLWIDEPRALAHMRTGVDAELDAQEVQGVQVRRWVQDAALAFAPEDVADVVIEAFACELPALYVKAMAQRVAAGGRAPVWLNLEYLSAEPWVEGTHGLGSPQHVVLESEGAAPLRVALNKTFFFPGFTPRTGGLLRERGLLEARAAFQADAAAQETLWETLGVPGRAASPPGEWRLSMFAYENPEVERLLAALAQGGVPVRLLVPEGRVLPQVAGFFGAGQARAGAQWARGSLSAHVLPFTDQPGYDRLLWACDLNFVRGEDSFVRAQWAARPFVWQIYPQEEAAHHVKLSAFWRLYVQGAQGAQGLDAAGGAAMEAAWAGWNAMGGLGLPAPDWGLVWAQLQAHRALFEAHAAAWAGQLARQPDLAAQLVEFAAKVAN